MKKLRTVVSNHRLIVFYCLVFIWCGFLFFLTGMVLNPSLTKFLSRHMLFIENISIDEDEIMSIVVAPIVEEIIKFVGYGVIFLTPPYFWRWYNSKGDFINEHIMPVFLISAGLFGFMEGSSHNPTKLGFILFWMYVILNSCIHITYSIYPFILGRCYGNWFAIFLPIAMLLHATHNFILDFLWDNKWVTFAMFSIFLVPFLIITRKDICCKTIYFIENYFPRFFIKRRMKEVIYLLFICLYLLMLLSVMFYKR